jgi:hypothetical protein
MRLTTRLPLSIEDRLFVPVRADVEGEPAVRRRQPVAFLVLPGASIVCQRTIPVGFQVLVLGAERIAVQGSDGKSGIGRTGLETRNLRLAGSGPSEK